VQRKERVKRTCRPTSDSIAASTAATITCSGREGDARDTCGARVQYLWLHETQLRADNFHDGVVAEGEKRSHALAACVIADVPVASKPQEGAVKQSFACDKRHTQNTFERPVPQTRHCERARVTHAPGLTLIMQVSCRTSFSFSPDCIPASIPLLAYAAACSASSCVK
jgi:hypothetical protein